MRGAPDDLLAAASAALCAALESDPPPVFVRLSAAAQRAQVEDARVRRLIAIGEAVEAVEPLSADHPSGLGTFAQGFNHCLRKLRAAGGGL